MIRRLFAKLKMLTNGLYLKILSSGRKWCIVYYCSADCDMKGHSVGTTMLKRSSLEGGNRIFLSILIWQGYMKTLGHIDGVQLEKLTESPKHQPLTNELQGSSSALTGCIDRPIYTVCVCTPAHAVCVWGTCISQIGFERWNVDFYKKH